MHQNDRYKKSLFVDQDEEEYIAQIAKVLAFSFLLTDIFKDNSRKLNFRKFLINNDIYIYSFILYTDYDSFANVIKKNLIDIKQTGSTHTNIEYANQIITVIYDFLVLAKNWYDNLDENDPIKNLLYIYGKNNLAPELVKLYRFVSTFNEKNKNSVVYKIIDFLEKSCASYGINLSQRIQEDTRTINYLSFLGILQNITDSIIAELSQLQNIAKQKFYHKLYNAEQSPHVNLLLSFLFSLGSIHKSFNGNVRKHLEYYYQGILGYQPYPEVFDKASLFFINKNHHSVDINNYTKFFGGNDEHGQEIVFQTNTSLHLGTLQIERIITVSFSGIKINSFDALPEANIELAEYHMSEVYKQNQRLYLFSKKYSNSTCLSKMCDIGKFSFFLFSESFFLAEGHRKITLKLTPTQTSIDELVKKMESLHLFCKDQNTTIKLFISIFIKAFAIYYSSTHGLEKIQEKDIEFKFDFTKRQFILSVTLNENMPAFTETKECIIEHYTNKKPVMKISLCNKELLWAWMLFCHIDFVGVNIHTNVKNYKQILLQNDFSQAENGQLFDVFGPTPQIGACFYIGSEEVFNKHLTDLKIFIEWDGLPDDFYKYYEGYDINVKNEDFTVCLSSLHNAHWEPICNKQTFNLFQTITDNGGYSQLCNTTIIKDIDIRSLKLNSQHKYSLDNNILSKCVGGWLKIELTNPTCAFGHAIYPQKIIEQTTKHQGTFFFRNIFKTLNTPYTPKIKNIKIDYSSQEEKIPTTDNIQIIKTSPLGYTEVFLCNNSLDINIKSFNFTSPDSYASVNIEIYNINETTFTLYFHLDESSILPAASEYKVCFQYLYDNKWRSMKIISDKTKNLSISGNIKFETPLLNNKHNTILKNSEKNSLWLQIFFDHPKHLLPTIVGIYPEMITAVRISKNKGHYLLAANSINSIIDDSINNVDIIQPFNSFGGREEETHEKMYCRISERLNHKMRAVSSIDYNRIILEKFPSIICSRCINTAQKENLNIATPGHITITVIPDKIINIENKRNFPQASHDMLERIKNEIQKYSSPFISIDVINPEYEEIKCLVTISFNDHSQNDIFKKRLNNELKMYISPWLYKYSKDMPIRDIIRVKDIIHFIKNKDYVQTISHFVVLQKNKSGIYLYTKYNDVIQPLYPHTIFYSATKHNISVESKLNVSSDINLGTMQIGNDFIVGSFEACGHATTITNNISLKEQIEDYYLFFKK
ncbi:MAG: baseplate J/gp47 family protein [Cytophagales bacterium]|nr:baseplate J/gp47 family protein [Cytophagales bacterium]